MRDKFTLTWYILTLMGISATGYVVSMSISTYKYASAIWETPRSTIPSFFSMLLEAGKPALHRYQIFLWTFIGITIYLVLFFSDISATISDPTTLGSLSLPNIDPTVVFLMGLSQGGCLGGKLFARTPIRIDRLIPGFENNTLRNLIILGKNFGSGGIILLGRSSSLTAIDRSLTKIESI
jgi:hypothetical protein